MYADLVPFTKSKKNLIVRAEQQVTWCAFAALYAALF